MPRQPRKFSNNGYLHIIVRGIGRQVLFEDKSDYSFYLSILDRFSKETGISVIAYCLMENHVHLLIYDKEGTTPLFMKKLGVSYSVFFNRKYDRCGHLFQDRYLSETIESETHLLTVFRYILKNPQKSKICAAEEYQWSSYSLYEAGNSFVNCELIRNMIGDNDQFKIFISNNIDETCMEYNEKHDDEWAHERLCTLLQIRSGTELQSWNRSTRDDAIKLLKRAGLSIRQIGRLTGIGRNIIQRL